jgi:hypothetical protein
MKNEERIYEALISILKEAKPPLDCTKDIENITLGRIRQLSKKRNIRMDFFDYIFGWVYIGWVRKSLVAISLLIISVFAYQQAVILKRINEISRKSIVNESLIKAGLSSDLEGKLTLYKLTNRKVKADDVELSEKQIEEMVQSIYEIRVKYKELLELIEKDPDLKEEFEKKLLEKNKKKFKL